MGRNCSLGELAGIGPRRVRALAKLGLTTLDDLLGHYPREYEDRREEYTVRTAPEGRAVCVRALVAEPPRLSRIRKGLDLIKVRAVDGSGQMWVTFFNQTYVKNALRPGEEYVFYGRIEGPPSRRQMTNPEFEPAGRTKWTGRIMPVYSLTAGISNRLMVGWVEEALDRCEGEIEETLPLPLRERFQLAGAGWSRRQIHFPNGWEELAAARRRLIFEELFTLSLGLERLKNRRERGQGAVMGAGEWEAFLQNLPFAPTKAQRRAMEECAADLASGRLMNRLIQGDVGSGKTAVAAACLWTAARGGWQGAMMAPTELLAQQHQRSLSKLLSPGGIQVGLLTGSMRAAEKRSLRAGLADGTIQVVVGTHALLSEGVEFANLGLVVTDEQHRFGVAQRADLIAKGKEKGCPPHVLVMSATPIPRTLALILYGDLDVSVIDELPPGRTPVETYVIGEDKRQRMYRFVRKLVGEGRQAYLVCPAVEEGEGADLKAVTTYAETLQREVFPDLRVSLLHGKLRPKEKEDTMAAFLRGEIDVLVATTVIEVGVDVPNAALIVVENAERFGLSQLHQLRGRVGRGKHKSYCILMAGGGGEDSLRRLKILASTTDGFQVAEEDLKIRGPGDFFGRRQHGLPQLRIADLAGDMELMRQAQQAARNLLKRDPELEQPQHTLLRQQVERLLRAQGENLN